MLQPRKRKFTLRIVPKGLLLCVIILLTFTLNLHFAEGEDEKAGLIRDKIRRGERVIRHGDVNIVVLDEFDRHKVTPSMGLLSTTARTFIQEGTTTEFATHVYGTTIGNKYAHIVSTGTKIFYENARRPSKDMADHDPIITVPPIDLTDFTSPSDGDNFVLPSKVSTKPSDKSPIRSNERTLHDKEPATMHRQELLNKDAKSLKVYIHSIAEKGPITRSQFASPAAEEQKSQVHVSVRKETSSLSAIKPAKVKVKNQLPTFTVAKNGGDSFELETNENQIQNSEFEVDNVVSDADLKYSQQHKRPPHLHHTPALTTTTYFGFADFVTTAGNTVIVFTPQTKRANYAGTVTSIHGEPTLSRDITPRPSAVTRQFAITTSSKIATTEATTEWEPIEEELETTTAANTKSTTTEETFVVSPEIDDEQTTAPHEEEVTTEVTTEDIIISTTELDFLVKNNRSVPLLESSHILESSFVDDTPTMSSNTYKTASYSSPTNVTLSVMQTTTRETDYNEMLAASTEHNSVTTSSSGDESNEPTTQMSSNDEDDKNEATTTQNSNEQDVTTRQSHQAAKIDDSNEELTTTEPNEVTTFKNEDKFNTTEPSTTSRSTNKTEEEVELVFKTLYTTYTYLTTYFEKSTTSVQSREEVVTNVITSTLDSAFFQLATDPAVAGLFAGHREGKTLPVTSSTTPQMEQLLENDIQQTSTHSSVATPALKLQHKINKYRTQHRGTEEKQHSFKGSRGFFISRLPPHSSHQPTNSSKIPYKSVILKQTPANHFNTHQPKIIANDTSSKVAANATAPEEIRNSVIVSAPLVSSGRLEKNVSPKDEVDDDQLSQESNTEETHPNAPLISLQTSYTTYTYFTTIYKGTTSDIISRLETVTNVNTEIINYTTTSIQPSILPTATIIPTATDDSNAPVTYYTTYTYWTTFYKDGNSTIKSREETVSSVVQPTKSHTIEPIEESVKPTMSSTLATDPVTYFTTFTYYTTSYVGNSSIVKSRLETVTNLAEPTAKISPNSSTEHQSANIESSTRKFNDELVTPNATSPQNDTKPVGTISVEEGKIIDAFGISTTSYTTRVIGTYIDHLYAQLIESTSSVSVDTAKHTNLINPPTTILNDKIYQTGLLRYNEGSIVKQDATTFYSTKIFGSVVDGQYTSVTETYSSVLPAISPSKTTTIEPTATAHLPISPNSATLSTSASISPLPAVIESSIENSHADNEENDDKQRRKPFSPVIRPFASRSRPAFSPKKKSSDLSSAATITRGITPTVVAIPALKSGEPARTFGSTSRNRFAGGNRRASASIQSSTTEPNLSSGITPRKYSRPRGNAPASVGHPNYISSSEKIQPSTTSSFKQGRYRSSSSVVHHSRQNEHVSQASPGSRFKPRASSSTRFVPQASTTPKLSQPEYISNEEQQEDVTEQAFSSSDDKAVETLPPVTTTETSSRRANPLLRFRKPASTKAPGISSTTSKPSQPRKNTAKTAASTTTTTTARYFLRRTQPNSKLSLKPANSFFPTKPTVPAPTSPRIPLEAEENQNQESDDAQGVDGRVEIEEEIVTEPVQSKSTVGRGPKEYNPVSIKPFPRRGGGRVKRQAEYGYKYENVQSNGQKSRYRRPHTQNMFPDYAYYDDVEYSTEDLTTRTIGRNNYAKSRYTQPYQQTPSYNYNQYHNQQVQQPVQQYQEQQPSSQSYAQSQQVSPRVRPSATYNTNGRTPFTLREKSTTTTPVPATLRSNRRQNQRKYESTYTTKRSRSRYTTTTEATSYRNRKLLPTRRPSSRSRYKDNDFSSNNINTQPAFDGTITVTYKIPTEATIPIISGTVTEYKNVITAKPSTQVLGPQQYSTVIGKNGLTTLQLAAENSETMLNGIVEVTKFVIQEIPTSRLTYTPTTIRGRKTSFSHVIPSTVYEIKPEVSTIAPQLNANAPLANLLLSQLLLGNFGIQQTLNPLLGLNQATPGVPQTEYKTKTTSYITTITHSTSNVLPITLRGIEIKTTVVDSSTEVITATEYLTETVVVTPTATLQQVNNQLNTLLLPALLQAQLLNQPQQQTTTQPAEENIADNLQSIQDNPNPSKVSGGDNENPKANELENQQLKKFNKGSGKIFHSPIEPAETSVVTLYLSGRKPGEFSTVLSTVTLDEEKSATLHKRAAIDVIDSVAASKVLPLEMSTIDDNLIDTVIKSGMNDIMATFESDRETQSLESIVGNIGNHISKQSTYITAFDDGGGGGGGTKNNNANPSSSSKTLNTESNHFLWVTSAESAPFQRNSQIFLGSPNLNRAKRDVTTKNSRTKKQFRVANKYQPLNKISNTNSVKSDRKAPMVSFAADMNSIESEDEGRGRYNLATKVMSNGVEVIIALDKSTLPGSPQLLRVLPTSIRPITLTPSTVTDHMIMMLPHGLQDVPDPFVTKTYLTTYTYLTTFLEEGKTSTSSEEKVISNILTENVVAAEMQSDLLSTDAHITLSSSPILATKVFETTYNVESTVSNENSSSQVIFNQQTVSNTITAADNFIPTLQPSESSFNEINSSPFKETSSEYTIQPTEHLHSNEMLSSSHRDTSIKIKPTISHVAGNITKTYFVTYTYYSTLLENGSTVIKSNVATSSDVVTEKYYPPVKRTKVPPAASSSDRSDIESSNQIDVAETHYEKPFRIFATKTYLTTFTYFTTLLQDKGGKSVQTVIRSRTKIIQNLVTETLNPTLLNSEYLTDLKSSLRKDSLPVTATATLNDGQQLEITAVNENPFLTPSIDQISSSQQILEPEDDSLPQPQIFNLNFTKISNVNETNYSFTTTILQSTTIIKNGATLLPGSQIIKFTDSNGSTSVIPVSDPATKHPSNSHTATKPDHKTPMNNFLNLGTLGINSLSALKPVISAMAGLWQNNMKTNVIKTKDEIFSKPQRPFGNKLPAFINKLPPEELHTDLKPPNRTPIYIPVGTIHKDNEEAESEDIPQQYPDISQRNKQESPTQPAALPLAEKHPMEKPLVSGGISISPGQVITANTDVIVGTPAVRGPRPPPEPLKSSDKSDIPLGMQPPPIKQSLPNWLKQEDRGDAFSTRYKFADIVKVPPKPLSSAYLNNAFPPSNTIKYQMKSQQQQHHSFPQQFHNKYDIDKKIPLSSEVKFSHVPINAPPPPRIADNIPIVPFKQHQQAIIEAAKLQPPILIEHSSMNPLLVDIRPSQVAQVIIPHGSQTAFIYSGKPGEDIGPTHGTKGEIINDPSPYPEENVNPGFVGLQVYGPNLDHTQGLSSKVSTNTIHLDIPIDPFAPNETISESHHFVAVNLDSGVHGMYNLVPEAAFPPEQPNVRPLFNISNQYDEHETSTKKLDDYPWQDTNVVYPSNAEQDHQRPFIFPQGGPDDDSSSVPSSYHHQNGISKGGTAETSQHHNLIVTPPQNDFPNDESNDNLSLNENNELPPDHKLKSSSKPSRDTMVQEEKKDEAPEVVQTWEILKEKPIKLKPTNPTSTTPTYNFTMQEHPRIEYSNWTSVKLPTNIVNDQFKVKINQTKENHLVKVKPASQVKENQFQDIVIGLSPPPLPAKSAPSSMPTNLKPDSKPLPPRSTVNKYKSPTRKPKPTNPPYAFEKPNPSPVATILPVSRPPATVFSQPVSSNNILYETDAPQFNEESLRLKPLNATGKIEPLRKWQTSPPPTTRPVAGNVVHLPVSDGNTLDRREEIRTSGYPSTDRTIQNNAHNKTETLTRIQANIPKIITSEKSGPELFAEVDRTTELISKWNEIGVISGSKLDDTNESTFREDLSSWRTPYLEPNRTKSSGPSNTIFGNLYTRPPPANIVIIPSTTQHHSAISINMVAVPEESSRDYDFASFDQKDKVVPTSAIKTADQSKKFDNAENRHSSGTETISRPRTSTIVSTNFITHTRTLFETITETRVVLKDGQPSTRTVVLTTTTTSTLIDTTTKIHTLLQPTSVLSTVTTTVSKEIYSTIVPALDSNPSSGPSSSRQNDQAARENESFFVVMTDKKSGVAPVIESKPTGFEEQVPDEANEISPNDVLFSGIFTQHSDNECRPECKVTKNEMCKKVENVMRCVCRPGFARMFPDHPCKPTYTYVMRVPLERQGADEIRYTDSLSDRTSPSHQQLTEATRDGLDRMVMQSNLRDIYHGIVVSGFVPAKNSDKAAVVYIVQLSENAEETKLQEEIHKTLRANNYSIGGTDLYAAPDMFHIIQAEDFDECGDNKYHDCSEHAQCFNLRGSYTCSCKEGFTDMSYNTQFPGRVCSADAIGCELCNYHGTCYYKSNEQPTCECFQWYAGQFCQINLKVTLISLIAIGVLLSALLVVCLVMTCNKQKPPDVLRSAPKPHVGFRRYRSVTNVPGDKRAIVSVDTSSEGSIERTPPPFVKRRVIRPEPINTMNSSPVESSTHGAEQRDRALTVLIPRAKYRPVSSQPSSTLLTMSTFGPEQKLLYPTTRENARTPEKKMSRCSMHSRKLSNSTTNLSVEHQPARKKSSAPRRPSGGALVSAGFEVSATVRRTQELDEAYVSHSHDTNQPTYNSIRTVESSTIVDVPSLPVFESSLEDFISRVDKLGTVSEARSYDETTIQPPVRSLNNLFHLRTHTCDSKHSSSQKTNNMDEHHTMGERDLGSTYMPKSQLYKPDYRESDGSNFDSL